VLAGVKKTDLNNEQKAAIEAGVAATMGEPTENVQLIQLGATAVQAKIRRLAEEELTAKLQLLSSTATSLELQQLAERLPLLTLSANIKAQAETMGVQSSFQALAVQKIEAKPTERASKIIVEDGTDIFVLVGQTKGRKTDDTRQIIPIIVSKIHTFMHGL
jgi:hypothetical protein